MDFKKATMEDFDAAFDFIEKLWSYNTYDKDEVRNIYRQVIDDPACAVFFAMEDGQYRGFCHCAFFHTFWLSGMTCYLSGIITSEDVRGKGYGIAIMDEVKRQAKKRGCRGIVLDSGMPRTEAHAFYEKYGFDKGCYGFDLVF